MSKAKPKVIDEGVASKIREDLSTGGGYGKPPKHSQFKKGQSGYPAGRPRASESEPSAMDDLLLAEAHRRIKVVENGAPLEITAKEALIKASFKTAVRGNSYAQGRLIARIEMAERKRAESIERENEAAEYYVETHRAAIEAARAAGEPEPEIYPHPDDMIIEPGKPWRLVGPATKAEVAEFEKIAKMRDLFFLQALLSPLPGPQQISVEIHSALYLNDKLSPRMRLDDDGWFALEWRERRTSRKDLTKKIQLGWRELGIETPCGATFPHLDVEQVKLRFEELRANPKWRRT